MVKNIHGPLGRVKLIVSFSGSGKVCFYFLRQNRGAAGLQKGGAAEKFIFYFWERIGMREPPERFGEGFKADV